MGFKQAVTKRGIPLYQPQDILSDFHEKSEFPHIELTETKLKPVDRDENHPLYKDTPAYTYGDRTWLPKINRLPTALAITNSESVAKFAPKNFNKHFPPSEGVIKRSENILKEVFMGDAVQKILPRNFAVPYIGWHPVESKMRPRNIYDHTAMSWGRSMPREYGVPNKRKLANLSRLLFTESLKQIDKGLLDWCKLSYSVDAETHTQFIR